jgi:hypothetical protein
LVTLEVNVTFCPLHIVVFELVEIVIVGVPAEEIVIVIGLDVAVVGEAHGEFETIPQVIASLFEKPDAE